MKRTLIIVGMTLLLAATGPAARAKHCHDPLDAHRSSRTCVTDEANREDDQSYWSLVIAGGIASLAAAPIAYFFLRRGANKEEPEPLTEDEAWAKELGNDNIAPGTT